MATEKQKKVMNVFRVVLELILGLFNAHHEKDMRRTAKEAK